jgi:hypothetical protein
VSFAVKPLLKDKYFLAGLLAMTGVALFFLHYPAYLTSDGAEYLCGARFLGRGLGYSIYGEIPGAVVKQNSSPPLFSLILVCLTCVFKVSEVFAFKIVNFCSLLVYFTAYWAIVRKILKGRLAILMAGLWVIGSPCVWRYSHLVLTETFFSAELAILFYAGLRACDCQSKKERTGLFLACGLIGACLCMTRYAGAYVVAGFFLAFYFQKGSFGLRQKSFELFCFGLPAMVAVGGWFLRNELLGVPPYYYRTATDPVSWRNIFLLEGKFLDTVLGVLTCGIPLRDLKNPLFRAGMTGVFLTAVILFFFLWKQRRRPFFFDDFRERFLALSFWFLGIYLLANHATWIVKRFGITARFFYVLFPVLPVTILAIIDDISPRVCGKPPHRFFAGAVLLALLSLSYLCHARTGWGYFHSTVREIKTMGADDSEIYVPGFARSKWVPAFIREQVAEKDVLISNRCLELSYMTAKSCVPAGMLSMGREAFSLWLSQNGQGREGSWPQIFLFWQNDAGHVADLPVNLREVLRDFRYKISKRDDFAIALKIAL